MKVWQPKLSLAVFVLLSSTFACGSAQATDWCGNNGVVKLSFSEEENLSHILEAEPDETGLVPVDLYAILDEVALVAHQGEQFLSVGGFELTLVVEGAEPIFESQLFPFEQFNMSREMGQCQVGIFPGHKLEEGRATLVHWKLLFRPPVENVTFRLDRDQLPSCAGMDGCDEGESYALYVGTQDNLFVGMMFGAGYVPAFLNPTGKDEPLPAQIGGPSNWQEVGVFSAADPTEATEEKSEGDEADHSGHHHH